MADNSIPNNLLVYRANLRLNGNTTPDLREVEREHLTAQPTAHLPGRLRQRNISMMLLMISIALASLAAGVTIAYALCSVLFAAFRMHVREHIAAPLHIQPKTAAN